jgi:uncharacterized membrane protein (UPF0127 family)
MMKSSGSFDRRGFAGLLFTFLLLAAGVPMADTALKTAQLRVGSHALRVEVAASEPERQKGLMFREKMGKNDGMLFIFDEPGYHAMWMQNTYLPLSVAFVDRDGVILNVEDMEPRTTDAHAAQGPALYAIEMNKGWFAEKKIKPGDKVTGLPPGSRSEVGGRR